MTMALYKSAQFIDFNEDHDHLGNKDEIVLYEEKPSKEDVIEMHSPEEDEGEIEVSFKLPPLPGSDADMPLEVSTDEHEEPKGKKDKNDLQGQELEVKDPWKSPPAGEVLNWVRERFSQIPRHSGRETAGIERAISYLKRLNTEMSRAASGDYDGQIDIGQFEQARAEIYSAIERLEDAKEKLEATNYKRKKGDTLFDLVKEGKQTAVGGIIITVPILISRIAKVLINGMVSGGHDIERMFDGQVKEWSLDKREQAELMELLDSMGYTMPRRDRGFARDHQMDYTSSDNYDFGANYSA
jgi:hypothetical protein